MRSSASISLTRLQKLNITSNLLVIKTAISILRKKSSIPSAFNFVLQVLHCTSHVYLTRRNGETQVQHFFLCRHFILSDLFSPQLCRCIHFHGCHKRSVFYKRHCWQHYHFIGSSTMYMSLPDFINCSSTVWLYLTWPLDLLVTNSLCFLCTS